MARKCKSVILNTYSERINQSLYLEKKLKFNGWGGTENIELAE